MCSKANVLPPDGGWGWLVVFAAFLTHVIADGIVYSFGIFYVEFLDFFKAGKGETAWAGSLITGTMLLVGPLASVLINKHGCRITSFVGVAIATTGFILSIFSPSLYFLFFSFGITSGLGFGLIYLSSIVIVGLYFEERRALALGLAISGSGVGSFLWSPLSQYLIDEYGGWRGAILIEAGFILNCAVCGAVFRPLKAQDQPVKKSLLKKNKTTFTEESSERDAFIDNSGRNIEGITAECVVVAPNGSPPFTHARLELVESVFISEDDSERLDGLVAETKATEQDEASTVTQTQSLSREDVHYHSTNDYLDYKECVNNGHCQESKSTSSSNGEHVSSLSVPNDKTVTSSLSSNTNSMVSLPVAYLNSVLSLSDAEVPNTNIGFLNKVLSYIHTLFDISLLKNYIFLMFVISNFCTSLAVDMPFMFLADRARDAGISVERAKWILSAAGIANTVGKVLIGYLSDFRGVKRLWFYISMLALSGVATVLCPLCDSFLLLMFDGSAIGFFVGGYVSLTSIVLIDLVGPEFMSNGFGILLLFKGIAILVGPPLCGWFYDITGSYDTSFVVGGLIIGLSGVMLLFIPCVRRCKQISYTKGNS